MDWLFDLFGTWVAKFFTNAIQKFANDMITFVLELTGEFWNEPLITAFLNFVSGVNGCVAVLTLLIVCFDIVEENGKVNPGMVMMNLFKGSLFAVFARYIGLLTFEVSEIIVTNLSFTAMPTSADDLTKSLTMNAINASALLFAVALIALVIAFVGFAWCCVVRNASLFVLILSSPFYVADIMRGDTTKMGDWLRQVIAVSFTFVFQYILFHVGLFGLTEAKLWLCLAGFAGMSQVPKLLMKYGNSSGSSGLSGALQGVNTITSITSTAKGLIGGGK